MQILSFPERERIEFFLLGKWGIRRIARELGRDHGVLSREINRNTVQGKKYRAKTAQKLADVRAKKTNKPKLETDYSLERHVVAKLREDWSPEQIAGRLKTHPPPELRGKTISHETIYQYVYAGEGRWKDLFPHLRRGKPRRQKRYSRKAQTNGIPFRTSIHLRPPEIEERKTIGHWESDSMIFSKQKPVLSVQFERVTKLARVHKCNNKSAEATEDALVKSVESLPADVWKSITFDNGTEGARHTNLRLVYGVDTYHCDPYASWQKGGVENTNGLIRQYLPLRIDMENITESEVYRIQELLNNRPRKTLNYLTPNEAMAVFLEGVVH